MGRTQACGGTGDLDRSMKRFKQLAVVQVANEQDPAWTDQTLSAFDDFQ